MTFLSDFFLLDSAGNYEVSAEQGSRFAKEVAGDFNPIHNQDSKRFCVPGDLLFAIALSKYGLYQSMSFQFNDMVSGGSILEYSELDADGHGQVCYQNGKNVMSLTAEGMVNNNPRLIESLVKNYVAFSGQNFPHILMPLMESNNVMINPKRPLVIYESMSFSLDKLDANELKVMLVDSSLEVKGKRGQVLLKFVFMDGQENIGSGEKSLVLSGLRPYEPEVMTALCEEYLSYANQKNS